MPRSPNDAPPRRIACLYAVDLAMQAALRAEPSLAHTPFVVSDGVWGRARVIAVSPAAREAGVRVGRTLAQTTAAHGELVCRTRSAAAIRSAVDALLDVARAFGARVEPSWDARGTEAMRLAHRAGPTVARGDAEPSWDARGTEAMRDAAWVLLEVGDLGRLFPRETGLAAALDVATRKVGLCVRVGIASSKSVARIAAMCSEDGAATLVPSEGARAFLAGVPVSAAGISPEVLLSLTRFGLRTLGAVAALPADGVGRRLGREGAALWRLARGEDDAPLVATLEPEVFAERVELDYALDSTEPLSFLFSGALSRLCARLDARGLACAGLEVTLTLAPRGSHARDVAVAAPTLEASVLTTLVRLSLERAPPPEPVCGFEVVARVAVAAPSQAGLFDPVLPAPAKLAAVVARLCALCGDDRVGAPVVVDSLRPEAAAMGGFSPGTFGAHAPAKRGPSASDTPAAPKRLLALRRFDPPRAADVRCTEGRPIRVDGERLAHVSGPWRLGGEWWTSDPFVRDDYDVETTSGVLLRVYHTPSGAWWVSGIYD